MSKIIITKGKLLKNDKLEVEYQKSDSSESKPAECSEKHTAPPHKDLKNAFESLRVHVALLGEFISLSSVSKVKKPDPEIINKFNVSGFTIIGDNEGVILSAQKQLKNGALGFNTPIVRFESDSEDVYPYMDLLIETIEACKEELIEYLNGKHAPDPQQKLFPEPAA